MEENEQDKQHLIEQIKTQAAEEAERIRTDADQAIRDLEADQARQIERIEQDESRRADEQIATMEKQAKVAETVARRRRDLAMKTGIIEEINRRVEARFRELRDRNEYRTALVEWIVEGVLGLEAEAMVVEFAAADADISASVLTQAQRQASEMTGRNVSLSTAETPHRGSGGVVIRDGESARAYDNRVETRVVRYRNEIQRMIHERLFAS